MTDHHDDLASAYLDGQLSPEESARVEDDPRLMAEVEALAAVVERLQTDEAPVDAGTRQRHLSAALGAFDRLGLDQVGRDRLGDDRTVVDPTLVGPPDSGGAEPDPSSAPTNVIRLDAAAGRAGARAETRRRQGLPSWLSAAAALLVIGGGIGWFVSRQSGSADTAAVSYEEDSADRTAADSDAALSQDAESGAPFATEVNATEAAKAADGSPAGGAGASDASQSAAPVAGGLEATTSAAPADTAAPSTTTSRPVSTAASATSVPPSTVSSTTVSQPGPLAFTSVPTGADVQARLAATGGSPQPAGASSCGAQAAAPAGATLTGYVPITVSGVAGEGLFYRSGPGSGGTTVLVVRTSSCQAFP